MQKKKSHCLIFVTKWYVKCSCLLIMLHINRLWFVELPTVRCLLNRHGGAWSPIALVADFRFRDNLIILSLTIQIPALEEHKSDIKNKSPSIWIEILYGKPDTCDTFPGINKFIQFFLSSIHPPVIILILNNRPRLLYDKWIYACQERMLPKLRIH